MKCKTFSPLAPPIGVDPDLVDMRFVFGLYVDVTCETAELIFCADTRMSRARTQAVQSLSLQRKFSCRPRRDQANEMIRI